VKIFGFVKAGVVQWVCEGFVQKLGLVWECYFHPLRLRPGGTVDENETKQKKQKNKNKILENK
jgi:hypothetical protein